MTSLIIAAGWTRQYSGYRPCHIPALACSKMGELTETPQQRHAGDRRSIVNARLHQTPTSSIFLGESIGREQSQEEEEERGRNVMTICWGQCNIAHRDRTLWRRIRFCFDASVFQRCLDVLMCFLSTLRIAHAAVSRSIVHILTLLFPCVIVRCVL